MFSVLLAILLARLLTPPVAAHAAWPQTPPNDPQFAPCENAATFTPNCYSDPGADQWDMFGPLSDAQYPCPAPILPHPDGGHSPAGKPAVGMLEDRGRARILRIREWAEHVPLVSARVGVAVRGEGGRVLAGRELRVVGRRLRPGGVGGDRWHQEAGQDNGQRNAASALAHE